MMEENMEKDEPPVKKKWTKENIFLLLTISYCNFTLGTYYSLPAPFFPREAELKGATPTEYGLVFGVFQLVNLIMCPIWGYLTPHIPPGFALTTGMLLAGTCSILFGVLEYCPPGQPFIVLAFLTRIVESIGVTAYITTSQGMIPAIFPDNVATTLSIVRSFFGFGLIAGPTLGGALYIAGGYMLPFVVMGGFVILGAFFTTATFRGRAELPRQMTDSVLKLLASPVLIANMFVTFTAFVIIGYNDATLEPHLRPFGLNPAALGAVFIITGGIYALMAPVTGYVMDKGVNALTLSIVGSALCAVAFLIVGPVPFLPFPTYFSVILISLTLQGFGLGLKTLSSYIHGMADLKKRGFPDNMSTYALYSGIMSSVTSCGAFVGPSMGGALLDSIGYKSGTIVIFASEVIMVLVMLYFRIQDFRHHQGKSEKEESTQSCHKDDERVPLCIDREK